MKLQLFSFDSTGKSPSISTNPDGLISVMRNNTLKAYCSPKRSSVDFDERPPVRTLELVIYLVCSSEIRTYK